jgi:hypothetical protein
MAGRDEANQQRFQPPPRSAGPVDGAPHAANFQNRGQQNVPPPQYQNNNSRFVFDASSKKKSGGNAADWFDDRNNFDNQGFRGDFGAFGEGYFKGCQNFNQGNCGYHRQYQPYYNRNTGSRGGYRGGGHNPRYAGGRPPRAVEDPTANAIAETPQVAQATASRAPMFGPVVQPQAQGNADSSLVI